MIEVFCDENGRHMDEEARYRVGAFPTFEAAVAECRRIVEADLEEQYQAGMTGEQVLSLWHMFGRDPFISGGSGPRFSAWGYAQEAAARIAGGK